MTITRWVKNALLLISASILLITLGMRADLGKSDWAAWVQAVGSILAICGAVWTTRKQIDSQTAIAITTETRAIQRSNDALRAIVDGAARQFLKLAPIMNEDNDEDIGYLEMMFHYEDRSFNDAINSLETITLANLGSYKLVQAMAGLRTGMVTLRRTAQQLMDQQRDQAELPDHQIKSYGAGIIERLRTHYTVAANSLGGEPILAHTWLQD